MNRNQQEQRGSGGSGGSASSEGVFGQVPEYDVGASDTLLLSISIFGFVVLAYSIYSIVIMRLKTAEEVAEDDGELTYDEKLANADVSKLNRAQRRARARHIMKQQRRVVTAAVVPNIGEGENNEDGDNNNDGNNDQQLLAIADMDGDAIGGDLHPNMQHLSRKERQKAAKAAEKEERKLFEETRKKQQLEAQQKAHREKVARETESKRKLEEERKLRLEARQQEELAEYYKWKTFLASPDPTKTLSVKDWIQNELSKNKIVNLQEIAKRFDTSENVVLARIQTLIKQLRLTGIVDETNHRFIYVPKNELEVIASYMKTRDSVSLEEIAKAYQDLIVVQQE